MKQLVKLDWQSHAFVFTKAENLRRVFFFFTEVTQSMKLHFMLMWPQKYININVTLATKLNGNKVYRQNFKTKNGIP